MVGRWADNCRLQDLLIAGPHMLAVCGTSYRGVTLSAGSGAKFNDVIRHISRLLSPMAGSPFVQ